MSAPLQRPPAAYGWNPWPAPPPAPSRRAPLLAVLVVLVAAVIAVTAFGVTLVLTHDQRVAATPPVTSSVPPPTSAPSSAVPTPSPTPTAGRPTPRPRPTRTRPPVTDAERYTVANPLYAQRIAPTTCGQAPRPLPSGRRGEERYLKALVRCLERVYAGPLRAAGFGLPTPQVFVFTGRVVTPCGSPPKGYRVFYCSANQGIYSAAGSLAAYGRVVRLGGYWIAFHEYAHHVQRQILVIPYGYTYGDERDEDPMQVSRRIELQADCFMAMTGIALRTTRLGAADRAEMEAWRRAVPDEIHGRSASQLHWVNRGFRTTDFGRCNTWTATKHIR